MEVIEKLCIATAKNHNKGVLMAEKTVLFMSNGYGEDTIASTIIKGIKSSRPEIAIDALPLVGEGIAYNNSGAEIIGPRRLMPSGGMIPGNIGNLFRDFFNGLGRLTLDQISTIISVRKKVITTVAVGDIYPVIMSGCFSQKPIIMIGTAKSNYFYHYNNIEKMIIRSSCSIVFTRDEITAENLRNSAINAKWFGNVMMDSLDITGEDFGVNSDFPCIGILPGSRREAFKDIVILMEAVEKLWNLHEGKVSFVMAVPESIEVEMLVKNIESAGWSLVCVDSGAGSKEMIQDFVKCEIRVRITRSCFGDVLHRSNIIIGQAGTGNEQAVGMGKPVVTFDSEGKEEMGWYRKRQKGLLGDSISVVSRDGGIIAEEACALLKDNERYEKMKNIGFERMGPKGASEKIVSYLLESLGS